MRLLSKLILVAISLCSLPALYGQTCTGLCLQQVACPNGGTTTISGVVYTPNGKDPLPNVIVYIPNAAVDAFTAGVSCPVSGAPPSGAPLVGTTTAVDGSFQLQNVPVGTNIPLVIQSGRWRSQLTVATTTACVDTPFSAHMPRNKAEGDIPKIAIATGSVDQVECVLRKIGVDDAEFTNPSGAGRINLYLGSGSPGAQIDASTPDESVLTGVKASLDAYDVLMLPCQGHEYKKTGAQLSNFADFSNTGGRVYSSHYSYVYIDGNPTLPPVANWATNQRQLADGLATVNVNFAEGETLAQWLQLVGATTTKGQMPISTLRHDLNGVIPPTQSWLTLNDAANKNPVMQFVFDAPVNATNQCGRVLFNEYHVENPHTSPTGVAFPLECDNSPMTPQEKLLEYSLFELTNDGGQPTISPISADFGSQPVGFSSAAQTFTWTNHSTFNASAKPSITSPDFQVVSNSCGTVSAGNSCTISVVFKPTAIGPLTGTLTVNSSGPALTAALTGIGVPDVVFNFNTVAFGNVDVGAVSTQTLTVTNNASGAVNFPSLVATGDFFQANTCGGSLGAKATCTISVSFKPSATGPRTGMLSIASSDPAYAGTATTLQGNGVDFGIVANPTSGEVLAGLSLTTQAITTPIAGFAAPVSLTCTTNAPASKCAPSIVSFVPNVAVTSVVTITTVSKYTIVGFGGFGGVLWFVGAGSGTLLWFGRRKIPRSGLALTAGLMMICGLTLTGCSGKQPDRNAVYTVPGNYTYTLTATDGFLTHSATYSLKVSAK